MTRKRDIVMLVLVMMLAMVPRLWLWFDQGAAGMVYPGDQDEYYRGAIHLLLEGDYYDDGQWLRPPLTSLFLAVVFGALGRVDVPAALLVQCVVSCGTLLLLAATARRLFDSPRAGVAAALIGAVFLPYASYASQLLSETLFILTIALSFLLFEMARQRDMSWHWMLAGGVAWGLAALTRPVGVYALPLLMVWAAVSVRGATPGGEQLEHYLANSDWDAHRRWSTAPSTSRLDLMGWVRSFWRSRMLAVDVRPALALLCGFVLVVAPWTARNYAVYGQVVLVDTNGGVSFWLGNLREPGERDLQAVWNRTISNSAEREDVAMAKAIDNIKRDPLTFVARMRYKAVSLWQLDTRLFAGNAPIGITLDERSLPFALASDVQYVAIVVLALIGVVVSLPTERNYAILSWPLYGTLLSAVSLGHPRLRLPLLVAVILYAALPLAHPRLAWHGLKTARRWQWAGLAGGVAVFAFLIYASAYIPFLHSQAWLLAARLGGGEDAIVRAQEAAPDNYLPFVALGEARQQRGDTVGALAAFDAAASRAPQNTYTHLHRLALFRDLGDAAGARDAMQAVADVGWDNNQTYAWAWLPLAYQPGTRVDAASPAPGVLRGVYAAEHDGTHTFRWTHERAQIRLDFLPPDAAQAGNDYLVLTLRADAPDTPVAVSWQEGGLLVEPFTLIETLSVGTEWAHYAIPLAGRGIWNDSPFRAPGVVELQTRTHVASTDEPYPRGVALAAAWLEMREQ